MFEKLPENAALVSGATSVISKAEVEVGFRVGVGWSVANSTGFIFGLGVEGGFDVGVGVLEEVGLNVGEADG